MTFQGTVQLIIKVTPLGGKLNEYHSKTGRLFCQSKMLMVWCKLYQDILSNKVTDLKSNSVFLELNKQAVVVDQPFVDTYDSSNAEAETFQLLQEGRGSIFYRHNAFPLGQRCLLKR